MNGLQDNNQVVNTIGLFNGLENGVYDNYYFNQPDIIRSGLILYLSGSNKRSYVGSGTSWIDLTGNGLNGTLTNNPVYNQINKGIISFSGGSYVDIANNTLLNSTSQTIDIWFKINQIGTASIISKASSTYSYDGYNIYIEPIGTYAQVSGQVKGASDAFSSAIVRKIIDRNIWINAVLTFDIPNILKFYVNGNIIDSVALYTAVINSNSLRIARPQTTFWAAFNGFVGDVKIYNRVLTNDEITQNYIASKSRFRL